MPRRSVIEIYTFRENIADYPLTTILDMYIVSLEDQIEMNHEVDPYYLFERSQT